MTIAYAVSILTHMRITFLINRLLCLKADMVICLGQTSVTMTMKKIYSVTTTIWMTTGCQAHFTLKNESVNCEYENYYKFNYADTEREDGFYLVENKQSSFISMAGDLYIKLDKYDAANTIAGYTMQQLETGISTGLLQIQSKIILL